MGRISGGVVLAKSLAALKVSEVFALHGGHLDSFLVACADNGIRLTDTRHEATAGHAAQAYSRATGRIGVAAITAGPGFTNALTCMVDAWLDATPVLFLAGSPPLREVATNPLQGGFDQVAMAAPVTKWAHRITNVERIPDLVDKAVRIAQSGRPGPVFLELPIDIMFGVMHEESLQLPSLPALNAPPAPSAAAVNRILDLLAASTRPAIIVGGGALSARCTAELPNFAEITGTPVLFSSKGNGVIPADHPLNLGAAGTLAVAALVAKQPADLVIQIGARSGLFLGGRAGSIVPHSAKLIQIDIDGSEIGRLRTPDVAVTADSGEALAALASAARGRSWRKPIAWTGLLARLLAAGMAPFEGVPTETREGVIHPFHAAREVARALSPDTAIAYDGGEAPSWFQPFGRSPGPGLYMGNGYLGTLGVGQGFSIGLARARPGKPVAAIMGDGAAGFHIAEFDTMARHGLPILTVIFNNACWGMSQHGQELVFGRQNLAAVKLAPSAYHTVAEGFGCAGEQITRAADIGPAVRRAQASGKPTCLNIMTDGDIAHPVTAMLVGSLNTKDEIPVPYYENLPSGPG
ncbi:MAG: thiamine pyrophosphate-binding protein [Alphaproteobacteria bacterium]|nr:thiamine pyrophosphate-binding protein [Alphaproteobacteria bacterium]MBL7099264.1 thiamine pyrophosphate-binding protein [Alphaproteobacteria bacterium]